MAPLGQGQRLVLPQEDQQTRVLPVEHAQLLAGCETFRTLRHHSERHCRKRFASRVQQLRARPSLLSRLTGRVVHAATQAGAHPSVPAEEVAVVERLLQTYADQGLMLSEQRLREDVLKAASQEEGTDFPAPPIERLYMATRQRSVLLHRALVSYIENAKRYDRPISVVVVDDGRSDQGTAPNRELLCSLGSEYQVPISYTDRRSRTKLALELAGAAEVDPDIVAFALTGDERCDISIGACRNTFMLDSVGEVSVQADDDTVCQVIAPSVEEPSLKFTSDDAQSYRFYEEMSSALAEASLVEQDFLGLHDELLGCYVASCIPADDERLDVTEAKASFVKSLSTSGARVVRTQVGALGDSGMSHHGFRLFLDKASHERLVRSEATYRSGLITRIMRRRTTATTISDHPFCMTLNMGLDHRTLLPPFMPVQRKEDGVFGAVSHVCFRGAFSGFLPYCVLHLPSERQVSASDDFFRYVVKRRTNDLLIGLIASFKAYPLGLNGSDNLSRLGRYLVDLAALEQTAFNHFMRKLISQMVSAEIGGAERRLGEEHAPDYWIRDVKGYISVLRDSVSDADCYNPTDLTGDVSTRQVLFKDLVMKYGRLLIAWPALREAAASWRKQGRRVVEAL